MLDEEKVRHVAKLARITLKEEEVKKFAKQLSGILDYMEILNEVNTDNVPETSQVTGLKNVLKEDVVEKSRCKRDELLGCSELPLDSAQIRVLPAIK